MSTKRTKLQLANDACTKSFQDMQKSEQAYYAAMKEYNAKRDNWRDDVKELQRLNHPELLKQYEGILADAADLKDRIADFEQAIDKSQYASSSFRTPSII